MDHDVHAPRLLPQTSTRQTVARNHAIINGKCGMRYHADVRAKEAPSHCHSAPAGV
jgi:hypothetical protein